MIHQNRSPALQMAGLLVFRSRGGASIGPRTIERAAPVRQFATCQTRRGGGKRTVINALEFGENRERAAILVATRRKNGCLPIFPGGIKYVLFGQTEARKRAAAAPFLARSAGVKTPSGRRRPSTQIEC